MTHCESLLTHGDNHKLCHKCWDHTRCTGNAMHKLVDCIFMRARIYSCAEVSHLIYKSSDDSCHLQNDVPLDHCHYNRPINPDHLQKRRWKWTVHFAAGSLIKIVWKRVVVMHRPLCNRPIDPDHLQKSRCDGPPLCNRHIWMAKIIWTKVVVLTMDHFFLIRPSNLVNHCNIFFFWQFWSVNLKKVSFAAFQVLKSD